MRGETLALLSAAMIPALTAITWIAYRRPIAYARRWLPGLLTLCALVWVAALSFNAGLSMADAESGTVSPISKVVVYGLIPLLAAYVCFLRFLPRLLAEQPRTRTASGAAGHAPGARSHRCR